MTRTVVSFSRVGSKSVVMKLEQSPRVIAGSGDGRIIKLEGLTGTGPEEWGRKLLSLLNRHGPVKLALDGVLGLPTGAAAEALYFQSQVLAVDELPWEQLFTDFGFCALDPRWPVGRIAAVEKGVSPRSFVGSFNIVAVLSAAGQTGAAQLDTFIQAVASAEAKAFNARLHVISGEKEVLGEARKAGSLVTVEEIGHNGAELSEQIETAKPNILHFLCHGGTVAGVRTLQLATPADFLGKEPTGLVSLSLPGLVAALQTCEPWLAVLGACSTADVYQGPALAHDLANAGVPAVIGMRRQVDINDMNRFMKELYPAIVTTISRVAAQAAGQREIDWAETLTGPRIAVSNGQDPFEAESWSDPVLYAQQHPFWVTGGPPGVSVRIAELRGMLDKWLDARGLLGLAGAPEEKIAKANARIAELEDQLRKLEP